MKSRRLFRFSIFQLVGRVLGSLVSYVGKNFRRGLGKAGDLPGLDRVDELLIQAVFRLMNIFTDRLDDREELKFL